MHRVIRDEELVKQRVEHLLKASGVEPAGLDKPVTRRQLGWYSCALAIVLVLAHAFI